jgi:hypothetical protein
MKARGLKIKSQIKKASGIGTALGRSKIDGGSWTGYRWCDMVGG